MREENNINIKKVKSYKKNVIPQELKQVDIGEKGLKEIVAAWIPISLIFTIAGLYIIIVSLKEDELLSGIIVGGSLIAVITIIGVYAISKLRICKKIKNKEYRIYYGEIVEKTLTKTIFLDNDGNKREICGYVNKKFKNAKIGEKYYNVYLKNKIKNDYSLYWGTFIVDKMQNEAKNINKNYNTESDVLPNKLREKIIADKERILKIKEKIGAVTVILIIVALFLPLFLDKQMIVTIVCLVAVPMFGISRIFSKKINNYIISCDEVEEKRYRIVHEKIIQKNSFEIFLEDDKNKVRKEHNIFNKKISKARVGDEFYTIYISDIEDNEKEKNKKYCIPWISFTKEEYTCL